MKRYCTESCSSSEPEAKRRRIDPSPTPNLLDGFASVLVPDPILPDLAQMSASVRGQPLVINVPLQSMTTQRQVTLRFVQGAGTDDFAQRPYDLVLALDKTSGAEALNTLHVESPATPCAAPTLTPTWMNTTKIDTNLFSLTKASQQRQAHYAAAAQLLVHIIERALGTERADSIFTVVLVCKAGRERSLLLLLVMLTLLHTVHLTGRSAAGANVGAISALLFSLQLGNLAVTRHATEKFKLFFNVLGMHMASLVEVK